MAGHLFKDSQGNLIHYSLPNIYRYRGFVFEFHFYCGFLKLRKDFEPAKRTGRKFWKAATAWDKLPPSKKKRTLIYS